MGAVHVIPKPFASTGLLAQLLCDLVPCEAHPPAGGREAEVRAGMGVAAGAAGTLADATEPTGVPEQVGRPDGKQP